MFKRYALLGFVAVGLAHVSNVHSKSPKLQKGPNHLQASPVLTHAVLKHARTLVKGTLQSVPKARFAIQFFNNLQQRNITEGAVFLGQIFVTTNKNGAAEFSADLPCTARGTYISATATRMHHRTFVETSQFSKSIVIK